MQVEFSLHHLFIFIHFLDSAESCRVNLFGATVSTVDYLEYINIDKFLKNFCL